MRVGRKTLAQIPGVYSIAVLNLGGRLYYAGASEDRGGRAMIVDAETGESSDLWLGDMGSMNIIQIPGEEKILAITRFYPIFQSKEAEVCLLEPTEKGFLSPWRKTSVLSLPFVHRIGCFLKDGRTCLLLCSLTEDKDYQEDWSRPGSLYVAPVPKEGEEWRMEKVFSGLFRNHGLCIQEDEVYVASQEGVRRLSSPDDVVLGKAVGDVWVDGDYMATIEPFHGNKGRVYSNGKLILEEDLEFGHGVWIGTLLGRPYVIFASRGGDRNLVAIDLENREKTVLGEASGTAQFQVLPGEESAVILASDHAQGCLSLYTLRP